MSLSWALRLALTHRVLVSRGLKREWVVGFALFASATARRAPCPVPAGWSQHTQSCRELPGTELTAWSRARLGQPQLSRTTAARADVNACHRPHSTAAAWLTGILLRVFTVTPHLLVGARSPRAKRRLQLGSLSRQHFAGTRRQIYI